jgi:protein CMS1
MSRTKNEHKKRASGSDDRGDQGTKHDLHKAVKREARQTSDAAIDDVKTKRSRGEDALVEVGSEGDVGAIIQPSQKRARMDRKPTTTTKSNPSPADYDESVSARSPALLSDLFAQTIQKHLKNATSLEQSDLSLSSNVFRDTTEFEGPRIAARFPDFLRQYVKPPSALTECDGAASPHTAVIVSAGMRVADLYRALLTFNTETSKVGKLIAKHMKLSESVEYLRKAKVGIVVTTPRRLADLISEDAVQVKHLRRIVIDGSNRNEKKQTIFDMKEIFLQLMDLFNHERLRPSLGMGAGMVELMVF